MLSSVKFTKLRNEEMLSKSEKQKNLKYGSTEIFNRDEIIEINLPACAEAFLLHQAAKEGSVDKVKSILDKINQCKKNEEINSFNLQGTTPLHLAASFNRVNVIYFLLENGSLIDKASKKENNTALLLAAKYRMEDATKCLCKQGANVMFKNAKGFTALHLAAGSGNEEICKTLINYRCDINAEDNGQCTPLHMAVLSGSEAVIKLLIKNGANVYAKDSEGEAPIHYAAAKNKGELIVLLTKGALAIVKEEDWESTQRRYVNLRNEKKDSNLKKDTALHIAARAGYLDTVKTLVSIGANVNICSATHSTPMHLAAINGDKDMAQYLLEHNAKINVYDHQNMTPVHKACQFGRLDILKLLMEQEAQFDSKDSNSFTPLMWAVSKGHNDIVEYLLENGANVAVSEMNMKNVLHLAIEKQNSSILQILIKHGGASLINDPDKDFKRPLHYAAMTNDVESVKILIHESADSNVTDNEEKTAIHTAAEYGNFKCLQTLVQSSPGNINGTDEKGRSPLHLAAKKGWIKTAETLIEMGAQISGRDDSGWTPLDYAANYGHNKIVSNLICNGANVDGIDQNYVTPLHRASINGHVDCIKTLLNYGASISFQNIDGKNCLDLAIENHHKEACMIFISHERWEEALNSIDNEGKNPMEKLISLEPDIAAVVLENCVKYSKLDENLKEYCVSYDFKYLDFLPEHHLQNQYFGPSTMIEFNRENLLSHPLTVQLINSKWSRLGRWIYLISLFLYILLIFMLTSLLIIEKESKKNPVKRKENSEFQKIMPKLVISFTIFEIGKELVQAYILKKEYLKDLSNYLELILYSSTLIFMFAYIYDFKIKWTVGAVAIFFGWTNLLLYLKRSALFGIYVVMIIEVFKSLMSVIMVFFLIIMAFSLSFFVLLGVKSQKAFLTPGRSIMKMIAMTLGDSTYDHIFNSTIMNNTSGQVYIYELPYPKMSYILFTLFLIVCPVVLMNLLVGLAVGNIADVRKSAYMLMLKAQVDILKALESKYPLQLLKKVYCRQITVYPNVVSWKRSIFNWFGHSNYDSLKQKQEKRSKWKKGIANELELQHIEFDIQKKRMQTVQSLMKENLEITKEIAVNLKIEEKIYSFFEKISYNLLKHEMTAIKTKMKSFINQTHDKPSRIRKTKVGFCLEDMNDTELTSPVHSKEIDEEELIENSSYQKSKETIKNSSYKETNIKSKSKTKLKIKKSVFDRFETIFGINLKKVKQEEEDELEGLNPPEESPFSIITAPEGKGRISIFNLPNVLFDFSNTKIQKLYRSTTESESDNTTEKFSLHLAAKEGAFDRIQEIFNDSNNSISLVDFINERDKWNGFNALHYAARYNQVNVVEYLLEKGALIDNPDGDGNSPLLLAAKYGKTNAAKLLIEKGANVMFQNNYGSTALHYASRRGNKTIVLLILCDPNIDINIQDNNKATPLHLAICGGSEWVVGTLIKCGANVFAIDNNGQGPIHYAAASTSDDLRAQLKKGDSFGSSFAKKNVVRNVSSSIIVDILDLLLNGAFEKIPLKSIVLHNQKKIELVNSRTNANDTPLHIAARCGNQKFLEKLIKVGADVNAQTDSGSTPLHLAAINGQEKVVNMLLNHNSDIQALDKDLMTPMHRACQFGRLLVVTLLDEKGALLEVKDKNNYTPVMCAVWKGHVKVIKYLTDRGVQINLTDVHNKNVFHIAVQENQLEALEFLLEQDILDKINDVDYVYKTPVHFAAAKGNVQALEMLINKNAHINVRDNQERTPLHLAADQGHVSCVKLIISTSSAEVNSTDAEGKTPLHLAASNNHRKVVELLVASGADVCLSDNLGWSPLDYAARNGHVNCLQILLDNGASVDGCKESCYTPLHHASIAGHVECIVTLLEQGANIQQQTVNEKKNCLDLAVENSEKDACMAIIKHKRWHEALFNIDIKGTYTMEKIIELLPEVGEVVLNNCVTYSDLDKRHFDYSIKYNFEFVDTDPISCDKHFFAPSSIIRFQREKLLIHPLIVELINLRWSRMGRWLYLCSFSFYLIFVTLLTTLAVKEKIHHLDNTHERTENNAQLQNITYFTLIIAVMQILFQLSLAQYIGRSYIFNPAKILDFSLYTSTALFMIPFIANKNNSRNTYLESMKWQAGSVSILLGWCKILLYMENLPFLGLYVVMFMEVLYTLLKVLLIFSIMLFAFALSFFSLLDYQPAFSDWGRSIVKTFVMMLGEINYDSIFSEVYDNHHKDLNGAHNSVGLSVIFFLLFALIMIVVVMNLLVGLAVGDIESVRKNAYLRVLQRKVYYLNILDQTYPKFLKEYVYQKSYIQKPNQRNLYKKLMLWLGQFHKKVLIHDRVYAKKDLIMREFAVNKEAILIQNLKTMSILNDLEKQLERNKKIAKCIATTSKFGNSTN
ncbi:uncharacterized protein LOC136078729 [Hydra vulgaris]|uniref:Uncharacterized protein LOC136078729 n=1 Tax=Hydra vulgaris TaxID=6087 RepID=A0ABM4BNC9_HYDVU